MMEWTTCESYWRNIIADEDPKANRMYDDYILLFKTVLKFHYKINCFLFTAFHFHLPKFLIVNFESLRESFFPFLFFHIHKPICI